MLIHVGGLPVFFLLYLCICHSLGLESLALPSRVTWSSPEDADGKSHPTPFNTAWLSWVPLLGSQNTWHMFSHGSDEINCTSAAHLTTRFP